MFPKGKTSWMAAALMLALLFTASPGRAAAGPWQGGLVAAGWNGLWEQALAWLYGSAGLDRSHRNGPGKGGPAAGAKSDSSSYIDPNGQPRTDSSASIDPNGQPRTDTSTQIDPNGGK
jgi:hypothetical protein